MNNDLNNFALHASEKSGYVLDNNDPSVLPVADDRGRQQGRVPPGRRVYKANYEKVSLAEALKRMNDRISKKMDIIKGGVDDNTSVKQESQNIVADNADINNADKHKFELNDDINQTGDMGDVFDPTVDRKETVVEEDKSSSVNVKPSYSSDAYNSVSVKQDHAGRSDVLSKYLRRRNRLTFELTDSTITVPVIDIKVSKYSVTVIMPLSDNLGVFIPKPGKDVVLSWDDKSMNCCFLGSYFEIPELEIFGLSFVRTEEFE